MTGPRATLGAFLAVHVLRRCKHCGHRAKDHRRFSSLPVHSVEHRCTACDCCVIDGELQSWVTFP